MEGLTYDLAELKTQLADAERRVDALRMIIRGVQALDPVDGIASSTNGSGNGQTHVEQAALLPADEPVPHGPRGRAALRALAAEYPGKTWTLQALTRELLRRGWASSDDPIRAEHALGESVRRMAKDGDALRVRPGVYRFVNVEEVSV